MTLTPKEFDLLAFTSPPTHGACSRAISSSTSSGTSPSTGDPATVTVHVRRLREKIESDPSHPRRLVTVWGAGYRFAG